MGRLKDALWLEVWRYLQSMPYGRTLLTALNSPVTGPQGIRNAWSELQANARFEGMKKKTGLQAVLQERSDLFRFTNTEKGHLLIEMTEMARSRSLAEGLPAAPGGTGGAPPNLQGLFGADFDLAVAAASAMLEDEAADPSAATVPETIVPAVPAGLVSGNLPAGVASSGGGGSAAAPAIAATAAVGGIMPSFAGVAPDGIAPVDLGGSFVLGQDPLAQPPVSLDPDGPAARRQRAAMYASGWKAKGKGKGFFHDLIWTPAVQVAREAEKKKESEMARALFNAMENYGGQSVTLSQIGSDFKVAQMKKDNMFKNIRLLDILRQYEDVFELIPDSVTGGWTVKLQPGAQAALPDAEAMLEQELRETDLALPDRIENPGGPKEKMQALRIELLHALSRRGNRVPLQELGQEPRVQQRKQGLHQAKKLVDFIRLFPMNFRVVAEDMQMIVETASTNVSDQSMIDQSIFKNHQAMNQLSTKGGKGKGRGRPLVSPYPPPLVPPPVIGQPLLHFTSPEVQTRGFSPQYDAAALAALMQSGAVQAHAGFFQQPAVRPM